MGFRQPNAVRLLRDQKKSMHRSSSNTSSTLYTVWHFRLPAPNMPERSDCFCRDSWKALRCLSLKPISCLLQQALMLALQLPARSTTRVVLPKTSESGAVTFWDLEGVAVVANSGVSLFSRNMFVTSLKLWQHAAPDANKPGRS